MRNGTLAVGLATLLLTTGVAQEARGGGPAKSTARAAAAIARAQALDAEGETCDAIVTLAAERRRTSSKAARRQLTEALRGVDEGWKERLPHCAVASKVRAWQAAAERGAPETVTIAVATTTGWGCPCPPFVFEESGDSSDSDAELFFPIFVSGKDPTEHLVPGSYRLTGHFRAKSTNEHGWRKERGAPPAPIRGDGAKERMTLHPVFEVESWCFVRTMPLLAREYREEAGAMPRCRSPKR